MAVRRNQWLTNRSTLSDWLTPTQNEELEKVSLSRLTEPIGQSPLVMSQGEGTIGLQPFGGDLEPISDSPKSSFDAPFAFEQSQIVIDFPLDSLGHMIYAGAQVRFSEVPLGIYYEDLLDSLATEDFDPIVTEVDMDEIALG